MCDHQTRWADFERRTREPSVDRETDRRNDSCLPFLQPDHSDLYVPEWRLCYVKNLKARPNCRARSLVEMFSASLRRFLVVSDSRARCVLRCRTRTAAATTPWPTS